MHIVRPMPPVIGALAGPSQVVPSARAAAPRPDVPPVTHAEAPAKTAPRPPDHTRLALVQAGILSSVAPIRDYSPERTLKPWGVAMLPDSERAEERREAQEEAQKAARDRAAPEAATGGSDARPDPWRAEAPEPRAPEAAPPPAMPSPPAPLPGAEAAPPPT